MMRRYCEMCDVWVPKTKKECPECGGALSKVIDYCEACEVEGATAGGSIWREHTCYGKKRTQPPLPAEKEPT